MRLLGGVHLENRLYQALCPVAGGGPFRRLLPPGAGRRVDFSGYDAVAFGSSVHAGGVRKLAWLKKRLPALAGKRVALFFTGANAHPRRKPWSSAWPRTSPPRSGSR